MLSLDHPEAEIAYPESQMFRYSNLSSARPRHLPVVYAACTKILTPLLRYSRPYSVAVSADRTIIGMSQYQIASKKAAALHSDNLLYLEVLTSSGLLKDVNNGLNGLANRTELSGQTRSTCLLSKPVRLFYQSGWTSSVQLGLIRLSKQISANQNLPWSYIYFWGCSLNNKIAAFLPTYDFSTYRIEYA